MSRSNAYIKFVSDGTVVYGVYDGTADVYYTTLCADQDEAWDYCRENPYTKCDCERLEEIEMVTTYGGAGLLHCGFACRKHLCIREQDIDNYDRLKGNYPLWVNFIEGEIVPQIKLLEKHE